MTRLEPTSRIPTAGVYAVQSKSTGRVYVGSARNLHKRQQIHERYIRLFRSGPNERFRAAIRDLGADDFEFVVLERVLDLTQLRQREAFWMRELGALGPDGLNVNRVHTPPHPALKLMAPRLQAARQSARAYRKHAQIVAHVHRADMDFEASFGEEASAVAAAEADVEHNRKVMRGGLR